MVEVILTPTFNSMTPHKTSMVEFPVVAMAPICTSRRIEQTVVNNPSRKTPQRINFLASSILRLRRRGMGRKKMTMSKKIVTPAKA